MKYYIIAGEKSGDLHASNLIKALKDKDTAAEFRCWGGDEMQKAGAVVVKHYRDLAFMGFLEVAKNLLTILGLIRECKADVLKYQPDVLILVDYAGFNLRMAKFAKASGIRVFYYISPKVWAWNQSRALKIKQSVDRMFVIMPFEKDFYRKYNYQVDYVGNPVLDAIASFKVDPDFIRNQRLSEQPIIAILPGSRRQEISNMFDLMISIAPFFPGYQFVVAGVTNVPREFYNKLQGHEIRIVFDQTYDLLHVATAALVTSGTATLETALFEVPQVVCYKTSWVTYRIAKSFIKIRFISLVNLIADKEVVKELIQEEFNETQLVGELRKVLGENRARILADYKELKTMMHTEGASELTAKLMWNYLNN